MECVWKGGCVKKGINYGNRFLGEFMDRCIDKVVRYIYFFRENLRLFDFVF